MMEQFGRDLEDQIPKNERDEYHGQEVHETDTFAYENPELQLQKTLDELMSMEDEGEAIRVLIDSIISLAVDFHDEWAVPEHVSNRMRTFAYNKLVVDEKTFLNQELAAQDFTDFEKDRCGNVMDNIVEKVHVLHLSQSLKTEITWDLDKLSRAISQNNYRPSVWEDILETWNEDPIQDWSI